MQRRLSGALSQGRLLRPLPITQPMKRVTMAGIFLWSVACAQTYASTTYEGKVIGVSDGDTVTVLMSRHQIRVRLAEIDAPEKRQPFGERSKQSLSDLVYGKQVKVNQEDRDHYGRVVGRVYAGGLDVNAEQLKRGMAWVYRQYNRDKSLLALKQEARGAKRGLWTDPNPTPPWGSTGMAASPASARCGEACPRSMPARAVAVSAAINAIATRWSLARRRGST
jgi:micrococcal nuclease